MNLWVNRLRQLAPLAVALFFFSCEDDTSFLGYKNPNKKFQNYTIEIPVDSRVYLIDNFRTTNFATGAEFNRLLVGQYTDPAFGKITSSAITQYVPVSVAKIPTDAVFDSAALILAYDTYFYGSESEANQTFRVFRVDEKLDQTKKDAYFNTTPFNAPVEIGARTVKVKPEDIRDNYTAVATNPKDNNYVARDSVHVALEPEFGAIIFSSALSWAKGEDTDSVYYYVDKFVERHKGIAIQPDPANTMLVGFNPGNFTQLLIYYHTADKTKQKILFSLNYGGLLSYNQILSDRSTSDLTDLETPYTELQPANGNRYIQAGTGIVTEINFDKFLYFADTIEGDIIINDAQLIIENVENSDPNVPIPTSFSLRYVKEDNKYRFFDEAATAGSQDQKDIALYKGFFRRDYQDTQTSVTPAVDNDNAGFATGDLGSPYLLNYSSTDKEYRGNPTMFLQ